MTKEELLTVAKPVTFQTYEVKSTLNKGYLKLGSNSEYIPYKTCFRKVIRPQPDIKNGETGPYVKMDDGGFQMKIDGYKYIFDYPVYPKYNVGDILYVKETWNETTHGYNYKASPLGNSRDTYPWRPSIHMPKEAARIFIRITDVRVERLQDIVTGDYMTPVNINRDGLIYPCSACHHFNGDCKDHIADNNCVLLKEWIKLWNKRFEQTKLYGWNANPYVFVYEFERVITE